MSAIRRRWDNMME